MRWIGGFYDPCPIYFSELEDHIHRKLELALAGSIGISGTIESLIKSDFGTKQNSAAHPVAPHQSPFGVAVLEAGSLAFYVVQEVGADRNVIFRGELLFDVINNAHSGARQRISPAEQNAPLVPFSGDTGLETLGTSR